MTYYYISKNENEEIKHYLFSYINEHPDYKTLVEHLKSLLDENIKKFYYATEEYSGTCACVVLEMK